MAREERETSEMVVCVPLIVPALFENAPSPPLKISAGPKLAWAEPASYFILRDGGKTQAAV